MEKTLVTEIVRHTDGSEFLRLQRFFITVQRGPDKGQKFLMETPRICIGTGPECELRLTDSSISRAHLEIRATEQGLVIRDLDSTNGTLQGGLLVREAVVTGQVTLELGESRVRIKPLDDTIEIPLSMKQEVAGLLGKSQQIRRVFALLEQVADSAMTVLLEGESGTGKDVAAQALHALSKRAAGPLVIVDCGAIPPSLIDSEIFGHEKGAFTGASDTHIGALEAANGGTLFIDELGELPLALQPRLLRFLENQQVKRIGANRYRQVNVRVVTATNRNLLEDVEEGRFRQDLYFRISAMRIQLPPLRERPEDILMLARHFAEELHHDPDAVISDSVANLLVSHTWPGNVRELRNMVERITLLPDLAVEDLKQSAAAEPTPHLGSLAALPFHEARRRWQDLFERQYLGIHISLSEGKVAQAAKSADLPRQTFYRLMHRHGL